MSLELLRSVLSKASALNDLDCVDKLLGMIAPILTDPPSASGDGADGQDAAMQAGIRTSEQSELSGSTIVVSTSLPMI